MFNLRKQFLRVIIFILVVLPLGSGAQELPWALWDKVKEGQELLGGHKIPKPAKLPKGEERIALAVLSSSSGKVEIVNISVNGKTIKVLSDPSWKVTMSRNNGVNSEFKIIQPSGKIVVAMKYPVTLRKLGKNGELRYPADVVYSAYSKDLETPDVVANGQAYVDNLINTVYEKLNALQIKSRAFGDKLITEALNKQMVESLLLIEHIGTAAVEVDLDAALRRLYTTFGLNTINTFDYSRSSAGARGLAQFMPATYKAVRSKRPELSLKSYFEEAMVDHENAVVAQVALMDLHLAALPPDIRLRAIEDHGKTGEYLAAAYNGGVARVNWAIKMWGDNWYLSRWDEIKKEDIRHSGIHAKMNSLKKKIKAAKTDIEAKKLKAELSAVQREHDSHDAKLIAMKKAALRSETVNYLKKLRPVYAHLKLRQDLIDQHDGALRDALAVIATSTPEGNASGTLALDISAP